MHFMSMATGEDFLNLKSKKVIPLSLGSGMKNCFPPSQGPRFLRAKLARAAHQQPSRRESEWIGLGCNHTREMMSTYAPVRLYLKFEVTQHMVILNQFPDQWDHFTLAWRLHFHSSGVFNYFLMVWHVCKILSIFFEVKSLLKAAALIAALLPV